MLTLFCGLKYFSLPQDDIKSLNFVVMRFLIKLFRSLSTDIVHYILISWYLIVILVGKNEKRMGKFEKKTKLHIRQLRCIRPYLDFSTACTIATSIVHSKLDYRYCNSLCYRLPKSQLSRLQQIQNSLARTVISLPSCALFTGSESLNTSNTSSCHLPTKFSQLLNLHTFMTSSLLNVLILLALHQLLLLLGHQHHPL